MQQLPLFTNIRFAQSAANFVEDIVAFDEFGQRTLAETIDDIPYYINEFWTAGQRQSHAIHEISYRACFKAQLPEFFIRRLSKPNDIVFDPFMGRGTTPIQAALMGRRVIGNDINPLSVLLTRPRLSPIGLQDIAAGLDGVDWSRGEIRNEELLAFYHPETLRQLEALRDWISDHAPLGESHPDPIADWIRMVSINRLSGHSPGFFSGRSMPPNQAVSVSSQRKINEKLGLSPPKRNVAEQILKKSRSLLRNGAARRNSSAQLFTNTAWDIPDIPNSSVDLVVTSPPFLDIVNYSSDNWLRCWFAGIDPKSVAIDMSRTEAGWTEMVSKTLLELARMLRPGGYVAFEVGEVRRGTILLERLVWEAAKGLPFDRLGVMVNAQDFTKTANCWGVENGTKGTNTNRIVLLQRH